MKWGNRIDFPQYFQGHFSEFFENSIKGTPIVLFPEVSDTSSSKLFIKYVCMHMGFPSGSAVKNLPAMQEPQGMWVRSLGQEDPLELEMATHSSILAWKLPWAEKPGGLQSMGL